MEEMEQVEVVIVGAGAAGIGIATMLKQIGVESMIVLEKDQVGSSFRKWPKEMKLITPSFTTNFYGQLDINAVVAKTSPAFMLRKEHPTGAEYADYLREVSDYYELPIVEQVNVKKVTCPLGFFQIYTDQTKPIYSKFLIWAAGEFQYPNTRSFPGSQLCLHNSLVKSWEQIEGDHMYIIGGYESGIDAAVHLSRLGKKVVVLDRDAYWEKQSTDPSLNLSPYTMERLNEEKAHGRIELIGKSSIKKIEKTDGKYLIHVNKKSSPYESKSQPILATGFKSSLSLIKDLFDWHKRPSYCLLNKRDESTKTPGLFLVGPQVRHENLIFCFIYKYRQRFGVVANAIAEGLGLDPTLLKPYRNEGLYLDDLSCCGEECEC